MTGKNARRWIAAAAIFAVGCAAARQYPAPPQKFPEQLVEIGEQPPGNGATPYNSPASPNLSAPRNVLVLSGGGMNGAYSAGVLKGWTESGYRPQFDVVTGISTGALLAPYAFLGSQYDAEAERLYTSIRREDVYRPRLLWLDSLASSKPLEQQIAACATPKIMQELAEAHRQGRRLYVGTTNLDTKRLVVWDMGAIAARNSAESRALFQTVLLASCSVPGLLPPVPIDVDIDGKRYTELHVDGSVAACVFLESGMIGIDPNGVVRPDAKPVAIHVIVAGKLRQEAAPAERALFSVAGESLSAVLQTKTEGELSRLFLLSRYVSAGFRLAGVPDEFPTSGDCMSFDPQAMRSLFDVGYRGGKDGTAWRSVPPEVELQRLSVARTGTKFASTGRTSLPESWRPEDLRLTRGNENR